MTRSIKLKFNAQITYVFSYQHKTTKHDGKKNEPFKVLVLHQTPDTTPELQPPKMQARRHREHTTFRQTVIHFHNVLLRYPF